MERKDFLKGIGLAGAASFIPFSKVLAGSGNAGKPTACTLIPSETAGPFPLDLTANTTFFRQDVREDRQGVQLNLKLKVIGLNNCEAMPNLRVNIWHCDKDGIYSGYNNAQNPGSTTTTFLRGYQMTDANGEVNFVTIFPGWYSGRICHIHFQVFVSSVYAAVSQLSFDVAAKNAVYAANSALYTKGADPMTFNSDNIFSDGYALQMATLTPNSSTGGYDAYLEVTIQGAGTTGLASLEPETGGQFKLGQNYPNPYRGTTTIPFNLVNRSDVKLELFDLAGRKVGEIRRDNMAPGDQQIVVSTADNGMATGNYIYQLQVENSNGIYRQCKMMTAAQ
ncbi:T9SS type A sorting domain-containing protein [Taibaiella chishuiensis]|uniref:Putative secreted protein (Por secretion system target) n=1 Tax=Taibaiella chishuiensis TaxID=1434707 RepID=A0A2P8DA31_9BACT|nr:T9SS type A sorting domain-containing protein [Taibaiella chishuiensis]PSK94076.1 putative secreted protein (Por secretion system target) [Taibaiella chishuiensis]